MNYRIGPGNTGIYDARIELERISEVSTAVILHSRGGATWGHAARNPDYNVALLQILERLLNYPGTIRQVLIDSEPSRRGYSSEERVLFRGDELDGLSAEEAASKIRGALRKFGQVEGVMGGNSTKQLRIETNRSLLSIRSTLQITNWNDGGVANETRSAVDEGDIELTLPAHLEEALDLVPSAYEDRCYAEGDPRMVDHFRIERRRNSSAARDKRANVRAENGGQLICENPQCVTDWYQQYGPALAEGIFDIHHTLPLREMSVDHETKLEDLLCLCANCHRAEHRRMTVLTRRAAPRARR